MLKAGIKAPNFSAPDQNGVIHSLADYKNKWILLYFYPRDNTPGCTKEACSLRDHYPQFASDNVEVIGVSTNSVDSHNNFATKFNLPFTLLADTDKKIVKDYEANGLLRRISYLINPEGVIVKAYDKVKVEEHAGEVLNDLAALIKA
jgi:peroxiredoxin Q/BCP